MAQGTTAMIRVVLPYHLRVLAQAGPEVALHVDGAVTLCAVLDALEERYPMLRGTIRDWTSGQRRPLLRFYACQRDFSHVPLHCELPPEVAAGQEPLLIVGAVAGG